mmetsp:Transcript_25209/g.59052  ORF Transcript_25209/g.59052 Transcript_25209/m.59052 type:complete len:84 (+) Transcript_25209:235-486(+)
MFGKRSRRYEDTDHQSCIEYVCLCTPFWEYVLDEYDDDFSPSRRRIRERGQSVKRRRSKSLTRTGSKKKEKPQRRRSFSRLLR